MANINATPVVFEHGSIVTIGSDTILNIEKGTFEYEAGMWENKEYADRGVIKDPLQGDALPTTLRMSFKYTSVVAAGELDQLLTVTGTSGLRKQHSIVIKLPQYAGHSAGKQLTFAKCVCVSCRVRAGAMFDTLEAEFRDQESGPAIVSY